MLSGKEIFDWLYKIAVDKLLHFIGGLLVAQVAFALISIGLGLWLSALLSIVATAVVGGVKELVDIKYGVPSWADFAATMVGGVIGVIMAILIAI